MSYMSYKPKNQQPDILQTLVLGIFKLLWWLIKLPFTGFKINRQKSGPTLQEKNYIAGKRQEIEKLLYSHSTIELKHAVMESDKLVDYIMKAKGCPGETFADRLRSCQGRLDRNLYDQIWQGHKVRNQIAHESETAISPDDLQRAARLLLNFTKTC